MSKKFERIVRTVAAQLDNPAVKPVGFGNRPAGSRFESLRPDVQAHFHSPLSNGKQEFYCGKCMHSVKVG